MDSAVVPGSPLLEVPAPPRGHLPQHLVSQDRPDNPDPPDPPRQRSPRPATHHSQDVHRRKEAVGVAAVGHDAPASRVARTRDRWEPRRPAPAPSASEGSRREGCSAHRPAPQLARWAQTDC